MFLVSGKAPLFFVSGALFAVFTLTSHAALAQRTTVTTQSSEPIIIGGQPSSTVDYSARNQNIAPAERGQAIGTEVMRAYQEGMDERGAGRSRQQAGQQDRINNLMGYGAGLRSQNGEQGANVIYRYRGRGEIEDPPRLFNNID